MTCLLCSLELAAWACSPWWHVGIQQTPSSSTRYCTALDSCCMSLCFAAANCMEWMNHELWWANKCFQSFFEKKAAPHSMWKHEKVWAGRCMRWRALAAANLQASCGRTSAVNPCTSSQRVLWWTVRLEMRRSLGPARQPGQQDGNPDAGETHLYHTTQQAI